MGLDFYGQKSYALEEKEINMRFLTETKAADYIGIPRLTLKAMRRKGEKDGSFPLPYYRIGVRPMYMLSDLEQYLESVKTDSYQPKKR